MPITIRDLACWFERECEAFQWLEEKNSGDGNAPTVYAERVASI